MRGRGARYSTTVADDRGDDSVTITEALARLEVRRVQILGAMRKEVEPCSTDHQFLLLTLTT
jgi:hypothetical protein